MDNELLLVGYWDIRNYVVNPIVNLPFDGSVCEPFVAILGWGWFMIGFTTVYYSYYISSQIK